MPIFHDGFSFRSPSTEPASVSDRNKSATPQHFRPGSRAGSREGRSKELGTNPSALVEGEAKSNSHERRSLSRGDLIDQIKRTNSPRLQQQLRQHTSNLQSRSDNAAINHRSDLIEERESGGIGAPNATNQSASPPLRPSPEFKRTTNRSLQQSDNSKIGLQIERPRSALHYGDFGPPSESKSKTTDVVNSIATSPVAPWHHDFPARALGFSSGTNNHREALNYANSCPQRMRATSHSSLSNVVLLPTTSPLVQQSNNTDLDFSSKSSSRPSSPSLEKTNRRHTFSPQSFQVYHGSSHEGRGLGSLAARHIPSLRRGGTYPYQAHQPRRSLSNFSNALSTSTPQTPSLRPRRPSICSESSPLQRAHLVGSYEESILRGRMSTTPSKPFDFIARISVTGKGQCRPKLQSPAHVTIPFPAVFYSYDAGLGKISNDSPSPYVGMIDLENSLQPQKDRRESRRRRNQTPPMAHNAAELDSQKARQLTYYASPDTRQSPERRKQEKMRRRSKSPRSPPGGSYRIPQQGQLQIVITNANKTAIKVFLVPYDLSEMQPGQKTFIRQRSYSAGPVIDMPLAMRKNLGTDRPEAALSNSDDPKDRPVLRYLIHLNICCPSRGRYYLHKSIRVVFANRVPDGKDKLRNEIQMPEPRFSPYRAARESASSFLSPSQQPTNASVLRRGSIGLGQSRSTYADLMDVTRDLPITPYPNSSIHVQQSSPFSPIPFNLNRLQTYDSRPTSRETDSDRMFLDGTSSPDSPLGANAQGQWFFKRSLDVMSSSNSDLSPSATHTNTGTEGLLSRKLRGLDM